ncbi:MAG: prepilin-type N-terminal cleavage/methylation domain-containing protein [Verrucomicrobiae bacterium]|nr:prepilin-type N-terminal cleavage/methylation domain-containing protein [Verrucomicrobiae bacterium]
MKTSQTSRKCVFFPPGFTLVELLTVICILSMLVALLSPVLKQARDKSKQLSCTNNLRQLHLAVMNYAQEHDEYIVPRYDGVNGQKGIWTGSLNCYLGKSGTYLDYQKGGYSPCYFCPADPAPFRFDPGYPLTSYCINYNISKCAIDSAPYRSLKLSEMSNHANIILFYDGAGAYHGYANNPGYRHNGGLQICYVDGHVEWRQTLPPSIPGDEPWGPH